MTDWVFSGISVEIAGENLVLNASSIPAKVLLGAPKRVIKLDEITGIQITGTRPASSQAILVADSDGKSRLPYSTEQAKIAEDFVFVISKIAPNAGNVASSVPLWNLARAGISSEIVGSLGLKKEHIAILGGIASTFEDARANRAARKSADRENPTPRVVEQASTPRATKPPRAKPTPKEPKPSKQKPGKAIIKTLFGLTAITIYDNGFVKIRGNKERLMGISGDAQVASKTGLGRSVATVASVLATPFPAFNLASPNMRGEVYLAITTEKRTHMLKAPPIPESIKAMHGLLAAGNAVIEKRKLESQSQASVAEAGGQIADSQDLYAQLLNLTELHDSGALTDTEFASAKSKLLGS